MKSERTKKTQSEPVTLQGGHLFFRHNMGLGWLKSRRFKPCLPAKFRGRLPPRVSAGEPRNLPTFRVSSQSEFFLGGHLAMAQNMWPPRDTRLTLKGLNSHQIRCSRRVISHLSNTASQYVQWHRGAQTNFSCTLQSWPIKPHSLPAGLLSASCRRTWI